MEGSYTVTQITAPGYKKLEEERWEKFSEICEARLGRACIISQDKCVTDKCFAKKIILYSKGFI